MQTEKLYQKKKKKIAEDRKLTHQVQDVDHNTINLNAFEQQHQTVFTTLKKHTTLKKTLLLKSKLKNRLQTKKTARTEKITSTSRTKRWALIL